jgi:hypothetical protein
VTDQWENRIVGRGEKAARDFLANPFNFRIHTALQDRALEGSLDTLGWIDEVTENVRTGRLIDGHERIALALRRGEDTPVPYKQVDLSEAEELQALVSLDPIAAMAKQDDEILDAVWASIQSDNANVQEFLANMRQEDDGPAPDFTQYDTDIADQVEMITCPNCGNVFPK